MKNLRFIILALVFVLLATQPILAASQISNSTVIVASGEGGGSGESSAPINVDVTVENPSQTPAEQGLFGLNSTILIVIAVLVIALVIGMIARKN